LIIGAPQEKGNGHGRVPSSVVGGTRTNIGCVAADVEVRELGEGSKVSSLILAVNRNAEEADFFRAGALGPRSHC